MPHITISNVLISELADIAPEYSICKGKNSRAKFLPILTRKLSHNLEDSLKIPEKIYVGISVLMTVATLSLFLPKPYPHIIWDNGRSHMPSVQLVSFTALSLVSGIYGIIWVGIRVKREENFDKLCVATVLAFSFFIGIAAKLG